MNIDVDITGTVIKTKRLTLREWRESDLDDFFEYASVDGVGQMAGWMPHENKEKSKEILNHFIENRNVFCIEYNGKAIGSIGIERYDEKEFPELADRKGREIGFVLSKDYWGQGIMPEAVKAVAEYCFDVLGVDFLLCGYFEGNHQSARVQEKCGFKHLKTANMATRMGVVRPTVMNILQ